VEQNEKSAASFCPFTTRSTNYLGASVANGRELRDRFVEQTKTAIFDLWRQVEIADVDLSRDASVLRSGQEIQSMRSSSRPGCAAGSTASLVKRIVGAA